MTDIINNVENIDKPLSDIENTNHSESSSETPKKRKPHNGFLRNSNKQFSKKEEQLNSEVENNLVQQPTSNVDLATHSVENSTSATNNENIAVQENGSQSNDVLNVPQAHKNNTPKKPNPNQQKNKPNFQNTTVRNNPNSSNPNHPSYQPSNKPFNKNKNKSSFQKKPKHYDYDFSRDEDIQEETSPIIFSKQNILLSYIRQKSGFSPSQFWKNLDEVLLEKSFGDIIENNMSLISYVVLYAKEEIYPELLNKFGKDIPKEEYENGIFVNCMNKNTIFLKETLAYYESQYKPSSEFIENLIENACKTSYRLDNNKELMQWLDSKMLKKHQTLFWDKCIEEKNIVLFEHALNYKKVHTFLMKNYQSYEDKIVNFGKKHTVEKSFNNPYYFNANVSIGTEEENEDTSTTEYQAPVLNSSASIKETVKNPFLENTFANEQDNKPKVIIKKTRKMV